MAKKSVSSFLRRCKSPITARASCIVDEKTKRLLAAKDGLVSNAAMEGLKLALFYTALPGKAALTPIPTPPPSPPKDNVGTVLDAGESLRPTSTHSLPPVLNNRSSSTLSPLHSLPPPPSPPSLSSSPKAKVEHARFDGESTLDRGVRMSVRTLSPCPYSSTESESEEEESERESGIINDVAKLWLDNKY